MKKYLLAIVLTSCLGSANAQVTSVPCNQLPALTGDVTTSATSCATTIPANTITNAKAAQMGANSIKLNNTGSPANAIDGTVPQLSAMFTKPTTQTFTTGTNATYTTPANVTWLEGEIVGGGGGGAGSGTTPGAAGAGGNTCFNTSGTACTSPLYQATGGGAGQTGTSAAGGGVGGSLSCNDSQAGGTGGAATGSTNSPGGQGGQSRYAGAGAFGPPAGNGLAAIANSGSAGGGAGDSSTANTGGGGGAGGWCLFIITSPAGSYVFTIGASGAGGTLGTSGTAGGAGAAGKLRIIEHYN